MRWPLRVPQERRVLKSGLDRNFELTLQALGIYFSRRHKNRLKIALRSVHAEQNFVSCARIWVVQPEIEAFSICDVQK
jgi:hypothetical protein